MIFTDRKITIRNGKSSINEPVILYRGDYEVSIKFTIMESKFRFKSGVNLVDSEKASHGQLAILAPYGGNVFSEVVKCEDGTVTFTLTKEMIDQLEEVGLYSFQIRLFDYYRESRVSIPPVEFGIEVREPVASEDHDNEVNNAIVGYSIAKVVDPKEENVGDTFDANGQYNKTDWKTGDRISEGKLNKIEDALDKINQNEIADVAALDKRVTNNYNVLSKELEKPVTLNDCDSNMLAAIQNKQGETTFELLSIPRDNSVGYSKLTSELKRAETIQSAFGPEKATMDYSVERPSIAMHGQRITNIGYITATLKLNMIGTLVLILGKINNDTMIIKDVHTCEITTIGVHTINTPFHSDGDCYIGVYVGELGIGFAQTCYASGVSDPGWYYVDNAVSYNVGDQYNIVKKTNSTFYWDITIESLKYETIIPDYVENASKLVNSLSETTIVNPIDFSLSSKAFGANYVRRLLIQNVPVPAGLVSIKFDASSKGGGYVDFVLVEETEDGFIVRNIERHHTSAGINNITTNFRSRNNDSYYIGLIVPNANLPYHTYDKKCGFIMSGENVDGLNVGDTITNCTAYTNGTFRIEISVVSLAGTVTDDEEEIKSKTIVTFGDSLTEGDLGKVGTTQQGITKRPWPVTYGELTGYTVINRAKCGNNISAQYDRAVGLDYTNVDIVAIMIGTNGGVGSSTIADITDYDDYNLYPKTYYGYYGKFIEYLLEQNSNMNIYLICPPYCHHSDTVPGRTPGFIEKIRDAVKEIGEFYSLPVIDLYGEIGINKKTWRYYLCDDYVHLTQAGYDKIGEYMSHKLF